MGANFCISAPFMVFLTFDHPHGGWTRALKICLHRPLTYLTSHLSMKKLAFVPAILVLVFTFSSCCSTSRQYIEIEETEWIEEEVYTDPGSKGGEGGTVTVRLPVIKTVRKAVKCTSCSSWYCSAPDCGDVVSTAVLRRASAQNGSGEPHIGQIPTMRELAPVAN